MLLSISFTVKAEDVSKPDEVLNVLYKYFGYLESGSVNDLLSVVTSGYAQSTFFIDVETMIRTLPSQVRPHIIPQAEN